MSIDNGFGRGARCADWPESLFIRSFGALFGHICASRRLWGAVWADDSTACLLFIHKNKNAALPLSLGVSNAVFFVLAFVIIDQYVLRLPPFSCHRPRPEVRHYVDYWTPEQMHVLDVRPGITDPASIKFRNENELMGQAENPEDYYINVIMQEKIKLYLEYVENAGFWYDLKLIFKTFKVIVKE